jgi:hypothetical protein
MVVKRNKVPKRSKRIRGGVPQWYESLVNNIKGEVKVNVDEFNKQIKDADIKIREDLTKTNKEFTNFYNYILNPDKCKDNETCLPPTDEDIDERAQKLKKIITEYYGEITEPTISNRKSNLLLTRSKGFIITRNDPNVKLIKEKKIEIIKEFTPLLIEILIIVSEALHNSKKEGVSEGLKSLIGIISLLPRIKTTPKRLGSIDKLIDAGGDNDDLKKIYIVILSLIETDCNGFPFDSLCAAGAKAGEATSLYTKLKDQVKINNKNIDEDVLIEFIEDVIPIMKKKLNNITEVASYLNDLETVISKIDELNKLENPPYTKAAAASGGKKSSRATHKEILGKQMKIYTKPNDKKEYVKHKGLLISIKEYKEHMKHAATGGAATTKKVILGKERCIYKVEGSKQDHIKYKGSLITVSDYKNLMKK